MDIKENRHIEKDDFINTSLTDNFIGETHEKNGVFNFIVSKADFALFDSQERVSNSIFEFFMLEMINNPNNSLNLKKDFILFSYEALRIFEIEGINSNFFLSLKVILINIYFQEKNFLKKKFIFVVYQFQESGEWCLGIIENFFLNYTEQVISKIFDSNSNELNNNQASNIKLLYFEKTVDINPKLVKNLILDKLHKFYLCYINSKYKIDFDKCFKTDR
jgi:hypothetical protein